MAKNLTIMLPPIVDPSTKYLIVGSSMPGRKSLEKQQYYANPRNHFWPIVWDILKVDVHIDDGKRIDLLREHGIGL